MDAVLSLIGLSSEAALGLLVAIAVFATFLSIALPLMSGREMKTRMRSVALERDELRARERARMASERDNKRGKGLRKEQDRSFALGRVSAEDALEVLQRLGRDQVVEVLGGDAGLVAEQAGRGPSEPRRWPLVSLL